jgi:site-specific DNA recombinase
VKARKHGQKSTGLLATALDEVLAEYGRTSTDDQKEAGTIQNQRDFLGKYRALYKLEASGQYYDDGVSGTIPLSHRPEGRRLLEDARAGRFTVLLVYRLDRLGRNLKAMLDALEELDACGVTIRSATEPFDTATPIGRFIFQLLGGLAELERSTIADRLDHGRDRNAGDGKYPGGTIPTGYDIGAEGRLVPSERVMPGLGLTEAAWIRELFTQIADGQTTMNAERARLTDLGVPKVSRYSRKTVERGGPWRLGTFSSILHNPLYKGEGELDSRFGAVARGVPPLVDADTWERAQSALISNRNLATKNAKGEYLLRGIVRCYHCKQGYTAAGARGAYRCNGANSHRGRMPGARCIGAAVSIAALDAAIWREVRAFVADPAAAIEDAQQQVRDRLASVADDEERRRALRATLAATDAERERVRFQFRKGWITAAEAEADFEAVAAEEAQIRSLLAALETRATLAAAQEAHLSEVGAGLSRMRERVEEIERTDDRAGKRYLIELLVSKLEIETEPLGVKEGGRRQRNAVRARVRLAFRAEPAVVSVTMTDPGNNNQSPDALALDRLIPLVA